MAPGYYRDFEGFPQRLTAGQRRQKAAQELRRLKKGGRAMAPVVLEGRTIARTFWGKAWCENLEAYASIANRIERGRSYVRHGSVIDLQIAPGKVSALVMGSELYEVAIAIEPLAARAWKAIASECGGKIDSLVELLAGKLSDTVMEVLTRKGAGLFPAPAQITFDCSCPDSAALCKHLAAVLYGVGARLDTAPELLFLLRRVEQEDLLAGSAKLPGKGPKGKVLAAEGLSEIFGIDLEPPVAKPKRRPRKK